MPSLVDGAQGSKKRKKDTKETAIPSSKRRAVPEDKSEDATAKIQELENQISESRKYYNNIATLISMLNVGDSAKKPNVAVAVSLCRVFCRLIAGGHLTEMPRAPEPEKIIVAWLKERCQEYQTALLSIMRQADPPTKVGTFYAVSRLRWLLTLSDHCLNLVHAPSQGTRDTSSWGGKPCLVVGFLQGCFRGRC